MDDPLGSDYYDWRLHLGAAIDTVDTLAGCPTFGCTADAGLVSVNADVSRASRSVLRNAASMFTFQKWRQLAVVVP